MSFVLFGHLSIPVGYRPGRLLAQVLGDNLDLREVHIKTIEAGWLTASITSTVLVSRSNRSSRAALR